MAQSKIKGEKASEKLPAVRPSGKRDEPVQHLVHALVRQIPRGRVTTYGAIAAALELPNPRMVGRAMRDASASVPAHRVINSAGRITGENRSVRRERLEAEKVDVKGDRIVKFASLFWDPGTEL